MKNTFKKGLILGGLLAVGAAVGLALTKEGKELTEELQKDLEMLSKHLKKNLNRLEDITQEKFGDLAVSVVDEYAKNKELASDAKQSLIAALQAKWSEMEKEYLDEQDEDEVKK